VVVERGHWALHQVAISPRGSIILMIIAKRKADPLLRQRKSGGTMGSPHQVPAGGAPAYLLRKSLKEKNVGLGPKGCGATGGGR
jgi:hypothetical protein